MCLILSCFCVGLNRASWWREIRSVPQFDQEIRNAGNKLVVIEFYYSWCLHVQRITPELVEMSHKYPNVIMLRVNIMNFSELAERYKIIHSPTFVYLRRGRMLEMFADAKVLQFEAVLTRRLRYL